MATSPGLTRVQRMLLHGTYWGFFSLLILLLWAVSLGSALDPEHPARRLGWGVALAQFLLDPRTMALLVAPVASYAFAALWLFPRLGQRVSWNWVPLIGVAPAAMALMALAVWPGMPWPALMQFTNGLLMLMLMAGWGLVHVAGALLVQGFVAWWRERNLRFQVQQDLLRAKLDPHFLFNALNNMDVLIHRDPGAAAAYVQGLSELLRYVLYEAVAERVPLTAELQALQHYLSLERWRSRNPARVRFTLEGDPAGWTLPPMTLLPPLENAFKHSQGQHEDGDIDIKVQVLKKGALLFQLSNAIGQLEPSNGGGLGDGLWRQRLLVGFPGRHRLHHGHVGTRHVLELELELQDHALLAG